MKIPLCRVSFGKEEVNAVNEIIMAEQPWLAHGPKNKEFGEAFAKYLGVKSAVTVNSCASALFLSLIAYNTKKEVIVPSFTFPASVNAIVLAGAKPVFVDIDEKTYNLDPEKIKQVISKETQAIMPVHFAGQCCDMEKIMKIADKNNLTVIEDSAETIGSTFNGKQAGSFHTGCFSFFPTKNITTGEGGMIASNDEKFIEKVKLLSSHGVVKNKGKKWERSAILAGYNFRMSNLNAAIGVEQFKKLEKLNRKRIGNANYLNEKLKSLVTIPHVHKKATHVYQTYVIRLPNNVDRDDFVDFLNKKDIEASVHFSPPVHLQDFYKNKFKHGDLKITEKIHREIVTLPMFPDMTKEQMDYMVECVKEALGFN